MAKKKSERLFEHDIPVAFDLSNAVVEDYIRAAI